MLDRGHRVPLTWGLILLGAASCDGSSAGDDTPTGGASTDGGAPTTGGTTAAGGDRTGTGGSQESSGGGSPPGSGGSGMSFAGQAGEGGDPSGGTTGSLGGSGGALWGAGGWPTESGGMGGALEDVGEVVDGDNCSFNVAHQLSPVIGTVGIVRWSTDFADLSEAKIEFGRDDGGWELSAPVVLSRPNYRTLLLGMKGDTDYRFRIVAQSGTSSCTSPDFAITTEPVPDFVPALQKTATSPQESKGFIVTSPGLALGGTDRGYPSAIIFDTDGDVVWWTPDTIEDTSAARISWDGTMMWYANAYRGIWSLTMDGLQAHDYPELGSPSHDLAVLPHGGIAAMIDGSKTGDIPAQVVELRPNGDIITIAELPDLYAGGYHPNAIHYYPADDTFTLSDYIANCFVKFKRSGELLWQLGGKEPPLGDAFALVGLDLWEDNHGHHFTTDGKFLFFNNEMSGSTSNLIELSLDEATWTATLTWEHNSEFSSPFLVDVQRLPNGNVLASYSVRALLEEITPDGEVLQRYDFWAAEDADIFFLPTFGYANFRTSLYGPPPR